MPSFSRVCAVVAVALLIISSAAAGPNFIVILVDDLGYGDLSCFGSKTIATPRLDRLATEGTRFTDFYVQIVCGPSRSALLTGRQPVRSGGWSMPASEVTVAELLQRQGYATACIGKWDVSNRAPIPERMPNGQGFDYYYGSLGGTDTGQLVYYENNAPVAETNDMGSVTGMLTGKAVAFLRANKDKPFFLYFAHPMVHSIVGASAEFRGKSKGGLYGDAVEELDHYTGRLLDVLDELHLRDNTIVVFTSDNGTWSNNRDKLGPRHDGETAWGSSGPLREAKGSTYEGGPRVPCIVRWPGRVPAGRVSDAVFASLDLLPTFGNMAGFTPPGDRIIDGVDQSELLLGANARGTRDHFLYFSQNELHAVRQGKWKLFLPNRKVFYEYVKDRGTGGLELYDLESDIGETKNLASENPTVVAKLSAIARSFQWPEKLPETYSGFPKAASPSKSSAPKPAK